MLEVYNAPSEAHVKAFTSSFLTGANARGSDWAVMNPDQGQVQFPARFVLLIDQKLKLATMQFLR